MAKKRQSLAGSFKSAFRGLRYATKERSFLIQLALGAGAILLAYTMHVSPIEKTVVILLIAFVLAMETLNTALEILLDHLSPEEHHNVARIKELLAASVLIASISAIVIGIMIFSRAANLY